jgi:type 1 glutamine amidotransferase/HEAT repeat protein
MFTRITAYLILLASCLMFTTVQGQVTPDEIQKMNQAIPAKAIEKPGQPRKILVFTLSEGFKHDAIPYAAKMLELMGKKTGAFEAEVGDDMALFKPESLRRFDAVCFDNTTNLTFTDPALRKSLMDWVKGGKGVIGIHAATDNFNTWPEAAEMMGGTFDNHPWTGDGTWKVVLEDPKHPLMESFHGQGFSINDEIYRIKQINLRKHHRVLMALDAKDEHNRAANGVRNSDKDLPISWIGTWGKGRVFYCSLGHNKEIYWNPAIVWHYLAGIQYALGDFDVDATPVPFDATSFFDQKKLDQLLKDVSSYTYGASKQSQQDLDAFIRYVSDITGAQSKLEQQFLALLRSEATPAGKQFICSRLGHIGTGASVPTLVSMLEDSATSDMALFALESIPDEAVNQALCRALPAAHGKIKCGIVNVLGRRRADGAVALVQPLLTAGDEQIAVAAAAALGEIGNPAAVDALASARKNTRGAVLLKVFDGSLKCAERLAVAGDAAGAMRIYIDLRGKELPEPVQLGALRGIVLYEPENAGAVIAQAIQDPSYYIRSGAMQLVREVRRVEAVRDIAGKINTLPPVGQVQLLAALDEQRDPKVFALMLEAAQSKLPEVREAALKALSKSENPGAVGTLVQAAASGTVAERRIARDGLQALRGSVVSDSIVAMISTAGAKEKAELIAAVAARKVTSATPVLFREASDRDPAIRTEAAKALRKLAAPQDLPALVNLLVKAKGEQEQKELQTTVVAVARMESDPARRADPIIAAYAAAKEKQARVSLLTVAGKVGAPASLEMLRKALKDGNPDVRLSAIRSLSLWSTPEPAEDLKGAAEHSTLVTHRAVALRGYVRLLGLESSRTPDETFSEYKRALALAPNLDEKKRLISSMADARVPGALRFAATCMDDSRLRTEAELVTVRIADNILGNYKTEVVPPLTRVAEKSQNPTASERAKELLKLAGESDEFLTTWEYAGPYTKEGTSLFWASFPPEESDATDVQWTSFPAGTDPQKPWLLDFKKVLGGEDRVVYLRNKIWSDTSCKAVLEVGSDDGVKLWLNGVLVDALDVDRRVNPGDDVLEVTLQKGWNTLLLKVNQHVGEWGACVKLHGPRETPKLQGIRVARVNE